MAEEPATLRAVARRLHAHYDVQPELDLQDGQRVTVAIVLRLWAVHEKGARALPGCARCRELGSDLERIARFALTSLVSSRMTIEPLRAALYDSRVVPGADEVSLSIRVTHGKEGSPVDGHEERSIKELRARLGRLGIPEQ